MSFQIHALDPSRFAPLFPQTDDVLARSRVIRATVDTRPGYPCRVSLVDAEIGETVILVNYQHQPAETPFQASHAIYVRENAEQAFPPPGQVPELFLHRLISIRAFDGNHLMTHADVVQGADLHTAIPDMLNSSDVAYLHLHNAGMGCFLARVTPG